MSQCYGSNMKCQLLKTWYPVGVILEGSINVGVWDLAEGMLSH